MAIFPELIYGFNAIPIRFSADIFAEMDKLILDFVWKCMESQIAKAVLTENSCGSHSS